MTNTRVVEQHSVCACSWANFTSGFFVGGLAGCGWAYACSQFLPFYY